MMEQQQQKTQRDRIIEEIRERRKGRVSSVEEWQAGLTERYQTLQKVVTDNIPEIWIGLEFELSVLRILNILGCTFHL
jgi:hypothetical protein